MYKYLYMPKFPKYVWDPKSKSVIISDSNTPFLDDSEYGNGDKKFYSFEEAKKYIKDNNFKGGIGIKLFF